ncbi:hypothetical protein PsorP6_013268 [Peronosclerospora sorghi]|uniref:Uncharacterized protein n=1 Tax=Peronosclerospora sorghi TaxID=230839 RepID=A0ACC0WEZ8_9STRA|nr:hypothetical protein PsorP6_013268 [Peronosclerospora sorghi]
MRIYPGLILSSLALVAALDSAAPAAETNLSTTQYKTTLDSVDERRFRTSGRELRVHETMDEVEDEEEEERAPRDWIIRLGLMHEPKQFSTEHKQAVNNLFPQLPNSASLDDKVFALKNGLVNAKVLKPLAKTYPNLLLQTLGERFGEATLAAGLAGRASHPNAPKFLITFRDKQMKRLVGMGKTPGQLVRELGLGGSVTLSNSWTCLNDFLKVYNHGKQGSETVSVLEALSASKNWMSDSKLWYFLGDQQSNPVAKAALDKLAERISSTVGKW